ncbi:MAG TPA: acetylglutamate kinase [Cyclobacteriaceae bacterium]|nr:acetylglutamate kinase [Cyclobacteriaceae bacterium]
MERLFVIKIGGNVIDNPTGLSSFLDDFASIRERKILVHGGGKVATRIGEQLGIKPQYHNGRRITDAETIDLVTMVYGGLLNKKLVAALQKRSCQALGMTGADGNLISAVRRPVKEVDFGFVGDITPADVNVSLLASLLDNQVVPIVAPLTHSEGEILNTNADTIAAALAIASGTRYDVRLIYCFEKKGVLLDVNDDSTVITRLSEQRYQELLTQHALADGILPKLENAFSSIHQGVREVLIGHADDLIRNTSYNTTGTLITGDELGQVETE